MAVRAGPRSARADCIPVGYHLNTLCCPDPASKAFAIDQLSLDYLEFTWTSVLSFDSVVPPARNEGGFAE